MITMSLVEPFEIRSYQQRDFIYETEEQRDVHIKELEAEGWEVSSMQRVDMIEYGQSSLGYKLVGRFHKSNLSEHPSNKLELLKIEAIRAMRSFAIKEESLPEDSFSAWSAIITNKVTNGSDSPFSLYDPEEIIRFGKIKRVYDSTENYLVSLYGSSEKASEVKEACLLQLREWLGEGKIVKCALGYCPPNDVKQEYVIKISQIN